MGEDKSLIINGTGNNVFGDRIIQVFYRIKVF
jgi:hypothetical protein